MTWLGPIIFMLFWIAPLSDADKVWFAERCAAKMPGAELKVYPTRMPWGEYGTISVEQVVCFKPKEKE